MDGEERIGTDGLDTGAVHRQGEKGGRLREGLWWTVGPMLVEYFIGSRYMR